VVYHGDVIEVDRRKVVLVSGSPRAKGNTDTLLREIGRALEAAGLTTVFLALRDYAIHSCIGCERCRKDKTCTAFYDGMHLLYPLIEESKGLVLGSPTYNYNITPEMKCFIDRLYPYFDFASERPGPYSSRLAGEGRRLLTVGVCEQNDIADMAHTLPAMRDPFRAMGYTLVEELAVTGHFPKDSVAKDREALSRATRAGGALAAALLES
jgi:multimeric flavodoxin WrbA